MSKYNILLMDDMEENLSSTKDLLRRWGYEVDAFRREKMHWNASKPRPKTTL